MYTHEKIFHEIDYLLKVCRHYIPNSASLLLLVTLYFSLNILKRTVVGQSKINIYFSISFDFFDK